MATWFRMVDCPCLDCGTSPCNSGCCDFSEAETGNVSDGSYTYNYSYNVTAEFALQHNVNVSLAVLFPDGFARAVVAADGSNVYDSGCINTSNVQTVMVPANTVNISAVVTQNCSGTWTENGWDLILFCE